MEKHGASHDEVRKRALNLLDALISGGPKKKKGEKTKRPTDLLIDYKKDGEYSNGWYFCIPRAFRDALDIKLTDRVIKKQPVRIWTQGSEFCFDVGDVLYDTPSAYEGWPHCGVMVQIQSAAPVVPGKERFAGKVKIEIWTPNKNKTGIEKLVEKDMSQDDFVKLLIAGPNKTWRDFVSAGQV